jgi:hypothetical protein
MHFLTLGRDPFSDQLRSLPLQVNQVPCGGYFQRCESKDRPHPRVSSRVNQNWANGWLPILTRDVNCCPSFRRLPIHMNRESTRTSDCSDRMTPNHTDEQRPSVLEDAMHVESCVLSNQNRFQCGRFHQKTERSLDSEFEIEVNQGHTIPRIMTSIFRSAKHRTHFAVWREHAHC